MSADRCLRARTRRDALRRVVAVAASATAIAGCGASAVEPDAGAFEVAPMAPTTAAPATAAPATTPSPPTADDDRHVTDIRVYQFREPDLKITAGTTVEWVNRDRILHTVTSGMREYNADGVVTSKVLDDLFDFSLDGRDPAQRSASYTFDEPGTYHAICTIHPGIDATITVTE